MSTQHTPMYGGCSKHAFHSMLNCPQCAIEQAILERDTVSSLTSKNNKLFEALDQLIERIIVDNSPLCMTPEFERASALIKKVRP